MEWDDKHRARRPGIDPVRAAIVHAVLVAGFLAVHFGVARLW